MKECRKCKTYQDCEGHIYEVKTEAGKQYVNWYHYGEVRFCPYQVLFIIEQSATLGVGRWSDSPDGSSYTDPAVQSALKPEAYYTKPEEILGEVKRRLKTTKEAGEALVDAALEGETDIKRLSRPAYRALMYCKGKKRKKEPYPKWRYDQDRKNRT